VLLWVPLILCGPSRSVEPTPAEEPVYQGKALAEWISDLKDTKPENRSAAAVALSQPGLGRGNPGDGRA
jgi:hypothetical protein